MEHDKFCIKWTPHRAATSYRIKLNPVDRESSAPAAVAALASGCRAAVSLSLSRQALIGDDVDTTHHLSAALLFIPAHMEEIKNIDWSLGRDSAVGVASVDWCQEKQAAESDFWMLIPDPRGTGWCWME